MLKQSLQQKLLQKLSPQQIQLMKLLQVPTLELEARIKQELEANPALEEGVEQGPEADDFDEREDSSEAMEDFDFQEYLDDETPDYQLSIRNHGAESTPQHLLSLPFAPCHPWLTSCAMPRCRLDAICHARQTRVSRGKD